MHIFSVSTFSQRGARRRVLADLAGLVEVIQTTRIVTDCRDPKDNKFLALAVDAGATTIVTGDADLQVLPPYKGVSIGSPADFIQAHGGTIAENFREARRSWKLDLGLPDGSQLELFSFPGAPPRPSYPEAQGLRQLGFVVEDVAACKARLEGQGVAIEPLRVDEFTGRRFTFFSDPDGLPLERYEAG